jgi:carboxyl-terminal processing protease
VARAVEQRLGQSVAHTRPAAREWALRSVLAGTHDVPRVIRARDADGAERDFRLDQPGQTRADDAPQAAGVEWRRLDGRLGYVRLTDLSSDDVVPMFDATLDSLQTTRGLILDLRETAAGGSTAVAEGILGRFVGAAAGYQRVAPLTDTAYVRRVQPRGPWTYAAPVVVLVGRWTAGTAEGMAMGLDALGRATVVGTPMAGLNGAAYDLTLPASRITVQYAAEMLSHVDGTPRESWLPPVLVQPGDLAAARPASAILRVGVETLQRLVAGTPARR